MIKQRRQFHKRPTSLFALALCLIMIAAGFCSLLPPRAGADGFSFSTVPELPALRRVLLTPDRLPGAIEQLRQGVLQELPRSEFEDKVNRANRAIDAQRHPPRLAEARYRARLADGALTGTGLWRVVYAGTGPGLLPLQPLNLALQQPRFENRDALIADFNGKGPSLLLEGPGDHAVAIEWSARAEERPEGLHFDIKFPRELADRPARGRSGRPAPVAGWVRWQGRLGPLDSCGRAEVSGPAAFGQVIHYAVTGARGAGGDVSI
jgi:hypothetical protein